MRIVSEDQRCFVELTPTAQGYGVCDLKAHVDMGNGEFSAQSDHVPLLKLDEFVETLDAFITSRDQVPRLEGVYGTYLSIHAEGLEVWVKFSVGSANYYKTFNLTGQFKIDSDKLLQHLADFRHLTADASWRVRLVGLRPNMRLELTR